MSRAPDRAAEGASQAPGDAEVFIATDNPYWELGASEALLSSFPAFFRRVAGAAPPVVALMRRVGLAAVLGVLGCQLLAGLLWAYTLVLGGRLLQSLLDAHGLAQSVSQQLAPHTGVALGLGAAFLGKLALEALAEVLRARLSPALVATAEQDFVDACLRAPLQRFDDPEFVDRMHRARDRGLHYVESIVDQTVALSSAGIGLVSGAVALLVLHPALLPVLLLCLLPQAWTAIRALLCVQSHWDQSIALSRQGWMLQELASQPEPAAELRALQMEPLLSERHRRVTEALRTSLERLKAGIARTRAWGAVVSGLAQGLAYLWLVMLVGRGTGPAHQPGGRAPAGPCPGPDDGEGAVPGRLLRLCRPGACRPARTGRRARAAGARRHHPAGRRLCLRGRPGPAGAARHPPDAAARHDHRPGG